MTEPIKITSFATTLLWLTALTLFQLPANASNNIAPQGAFHEVTTKGDVSSGTDENGARFCYFVEEGSSHSTVIGIGRNGGFLSLDSYGTPENRPQNPVRMIAAKMIIKNDRYTGEYETLNAFKGAITVLYPDPESEAFTLTTGESAEAFLQTISSANGNTLLFHSKHDAQKYDRVNIYEFDQQLAHQLLDCAKELFK